MSAIDSKAFKLLSQNHRISDEHQYTMPSPQNYPYQWLWDSCFHSIILKFFNLEWAKAELFSLVSKQLPSGLIPHIIYWQKSDKINIQWGKTNTSSITQPPLLANAVLQVFEKDSDFEFLKAIYPHLKNFYHFLLTERDIRNHHLVGLVNPDESGEDNSPRFDIPLNLPPNHTLEENFQQRLSLVGKNKACNFEGPDCMSNFFWVKDLPFNCFMVKNLNSLSRLAKKIGKEQDAHHFKTEANLITKAMKRYMYEDGLYWSIYQPDNSEKETQYKKIRVKTWAVFAPLYAKILTQQEAEELVDNNLLNKAQFWLPFPIPTVSLDEPSFNPKGFWRGPTWIATNWFVFHGLLNYGLVEVAKELYQRSKYLINHEGFREQFNPLTGEGEGARNFTWGTLVVDMERSLKT